MGDELGPPVRDHVLWKTMNPKDMVNDHPGRLPSRGEFRKGNEVNRFRKAIHHGKNRSIAAGWRQTGNKIQGNMRPGAGRNGEGMKQTNGD